MTFAQSCWTQNPTCSTTQLHLQSFSPLDKTSPSLHISEQFLLPFATHLYAVYNYFNSFYPHLLPPRPPIIFASIYHGQTPRRKGFFVLFLNVMLLTQRGCQRAGQKVLFLPAFPDTHTPNREVGHPGEDDLTSVFPERQGLVPHPLSPVHQPSGRLRWPGP